LIGTKKENGASVAKVISTVTILPVNILKEADILMQRGGRSNDSVEENVRKFKLALKEPHLNYNNHKQ
jgi:hypothetical protein